MPMLINLHVNKQREVYTTGQSIASMIWGRSEYQTTVVLSFGPG